jgi:hypothetical protein
LASQFQKANEIISGKGRVDSNDNVTLNYNGMMNGELDVNLIRRTGR